MCSQVSIWRKFSPLCVLGQNVTEVLHTARLSVLLPLLPFMARFSGKKTPSQPLAEFYCFLELIINNDYDVIY